MFGKSYNVKSGVWKILNARIESAQKAIDEECEEIDRVEKDTIAKVKAESEVSKDRAFNSLVANIIGKN